MHHARYRRNIAIRNDFSPFLAHLTKSNGNTDASTILKSIINTKSLKPGSDLISDVRFGGDINSLPINDKIKYFSCVCFTETPIQEIHCLLEINNRSIQLEPYGLVFLKSRLEKRNVAPVVYLNNLNTDMDCVARGLFGLIQSNSEAAEKLLPLVSVCGKKLQGVYASFRPGGEVDFRWEREWRYPSCYGDFCFDDSDVFCGLCPHGEIDEFEQMIPGIKFIDPRRNMKWYAKSLIECRQRLDLKYSVV